jgi:hypothetical protein
MRLSKPGKRIRETHSATKRTRTPKFENMDARCTLYCSVYSILLQVVIVSIENVELHPCVDVYTAVRVVHPFELHWLSSTRPNNRSTDWKWGRPQYVWRYRMVLGYHLCDLGMPNWKRGVGRMVLVDISLRERLLYLNRLIGAKGRLEFLDTPLCAVEDLLRVPEAIFLLKITNRTTG